MKSKNIVPLVALALVVVISAILFYYMGITYRFGKGYIYDGIIAVIFAIASYLLHSVINARNIITSFSYAYYFFSVGFFTYYIIYYNLKIVNIIILLIYVLITLPFIYWRLKITNQN